MWGSDSNKISCLTQVNFSCCSDAVKKKKKNKKKKLQKKECFLSGQTDRQTDTRSTQNYSSEHHKTSQNQICIQM